jgi:hypothetical protein
MKRPNRIDFENKHDVSDWLYFEPKYTKALNDYIDTLEKAISVTRCCEELRENNKQIDGGTSYATLGKTKGKRDM